MTRDDSYEDFLAWNGMTPRERALWPGDAKGYLHDQHTVEISLDTELAWWITENVVARTSFAVDLEETIITALRVIRGDLPISQIEDLRRIGATMELERRPSKPQR